MRVPFLWTKTESPFRYATVQTLRCVARPLSCDAVVGPEGLWYSLYSGALARQYTEGYIRSSVPVLACQAVVSQLDDQSASAILVTLELATA